MQFLMNSLVQRPALYHQTSDDGLVDPSKYLQRFTYHLGKAKQLLRRAQQTQWTALQQRTTLPIAYEPGEYVWYQAFENRDKDKISSLAPRYEGPYRIVKKVSPTSYQLDFGEDHPHKHGTINEEKLKPYMNRETRLPYPSSLNETPWLLKDDTPKRIDNIPSQPSLPSATITPQIPDTQQTVQNNSEHVHNDEQAPHVQPPPESIQEEIVDTPCAHKLTHNRHAQIAQHGYSKHSDGTFTPGSGNKNTLYAVPAKLIQHIVQSAFACYPTFDCKRSRER